MRKRVQWIIYFPTIIGTLSAIFIAIGGNKMDTKSWIAIIVALISISGTLIVSFFQLKRDGKTIDSTGRNTADIKPKIDNISEDTKKMRNVLIEKLKPTIDNISEKNDKIDFIANEIEYQKRLQDRVSHDLDNRDVIVLSINALYENNAALNKKIATLTVDNNILLRENNSLKLENKQLKSENLEYKNNIDNSYGLHL